MRIPTLSELKNYFSRDRIVLCSLVVFLLFAATCSHQDAEKRTEELRSTQASARLWRDVAGNYHATARTLTLERADFRRVVDSMARVLAVRPRQVTRYVEGGLRIDTVLKVRRLDSLRVDTVHTSDTTYILDTVHMHRLSYRDSTWLQIEALVPETPQTVQLSVSATITLTEYWKRRWLLGKKTYYTDLGTDNPYLQLTGARALKARPRPTLKVRPGVGVGLNYNPLTQKPSFGIQAGIYLIKTR